MKRLMRTLRNERGEYYHPYWMWRLGIPVNTVPLWLVGWLVMPLERYRARWNRRA